MEFINDLVNLTQGQLLIKYWLLWLSIVILFLIYARMFNGIYNIAKKVFKNSYLEYKRNSNAKK